MEVRVLPAVRRVDEAKKTVLTWNHGLEEALFVMLSAEKARKNRGAQKKPRKTAHSSRVSVIKCR
jgi:hypothetical protein